MASAHSKRSAPRNVSRAQTTGGDGPPGHQRRQGLEEAAGEVDAVASSVLQACVEVHRVLGPGFFESIYELALDLELTSRVPLVIHFNVPVLLRGVRRVVLFAPPSL